MEWHNLCAGFGVGLLVGLTGVGGGSLMTPILVLMFGVAPASAVGTDLWFAALTKLAGGAMHHSRGNIDWQVVRRLSAGSLVASVATIAWLKSGNGADSDHGLILRTLGVLLVLTALAMIFRHQVQALGRGLRLGSAESFKRWQPLATVAAGAVLGVLVTLTSVGAGALCALVLTYLYPLRMTPRRLVATDLVHAIPLTAVAGTGHLWMGNVDVGLLLQLLAGSIPGVLLGAHFSDRAPEAVLRPLIALVLVAVGIKLLMA
ncbi:MAG: hypothetical protein RJA10_4211 [Pseudomonadota bacterium]